MNLSKKYAASLAGQKPMRFKTLHSDGDYFDGIVQKNNRRFIVLATYNNFEFNGHIILPKRHIKGYRDSEWEICENDIIRQNGQINKASIPKWLQECSSLKDIITQICKRKIWPTIETISTDKSNTSFYIGKILECTDSDFTLYHYDATGQWIDAFKIKYTEIFKIELGDRYSKHFNKYMKNSTT